MIAEVIINSNVKNLNKTFDYNIPYEMETKVKIGSRVLVKFGNIKKLEEGFVVNIKEKSDWDNLKNIDVVEEKDFIDEPKIELAKWMAHRYFCNVSDCIKLMLPPGTGTKDVTKRVKEKSLNSVRLIKNELEINEDIECKILKSEKQIKVLKFLLDNDDVLISDLENFTEVSKAIIKTLEKNGYVEIYEKQIERNPFLHKVIEKNVNLNLTEEQQYAYNMVENAIDDYMNSEFLLYGVTRFTEKRRFIYN
ncbi:MAG: hypothetical protein IJ890_08105 [Clostridia bacterium]|nr:hypothetical protein [Clostridia bacterium]